MSLLPLNVGDEAAIRRALDEDGYARIVGAVDRELVESLRRDVEEILSQTGWLRLGILGGRTSSVRTEAFSRIQALETLHRAASSPELLRALSRVLDGDVFCHPRKTVRIVAPGTVEETTQPHQDYPYIQGTIDALTCWLPFHDVPLERGPLRVVPGSHRAGLLPMGYVSGDGGVGVKNPPQSGWAADDIHQGDIVVFRSTLVHAALPNLTTDFRLSVDFRCQRTCDEVCEPETKPYPDFLGRSSWAQIGGDVWSAATLASCTPPNLRTVPFVAPKDLDTWLADLQALVTRGSAIWDEP